MPGIHNLSPATILLMPPTLSTTPTDTLIKKGLFSMGTAVVTVAIYHQVENFLNKPGYDLLAGCLSPDKFDQYLELRQNNLDLVTDVAALSLALFLTSVSEGHIISMQRNIAHLFDRACCCVAKACRYLVRGGG